MQEALNQKIDAFVAANKEQILKDIATLVSINSVEGAPEEGAPYGAGPRAALDKTLELAAGMGLATRNCENHIGYAELAGADAEKYLATICHVDVVPEGNGWTEDPFKMEIRDGWMIGRGVADDKGPMVATLYALKFLKEEGVSLRYPIRALVGDNEETHMHDVDYYLANYPAPVFCFTPDAEFPVCNGEKGHFDGKLVSPVCNGLIKDFVGGVATNAVPDRASALVATDITKLRNAPNITLEPEGDGVRIRGWGKSGHAAMPEGTVNAIGLVVNYLLDNDLCNDAERAYLEAVKKLHDSTAGVGLGIVDHHVTRGQQAVDDREHALVAEVEQEGILLADKLGQFTLQLLVVLGLTAHHAGSHRGGHAELGGTLGIGLAHLGMVGQSEVVVQTPVQHHLAPEFHVGADLALQLRKCEISVRIRHVLTDGSAGVLLEPVKNINHIYLNFMCLASLCRTRTVRICK